MWICESMHTLSGHKQTYVHQQRRNHYGVWIVVGKWSVERQWTLWLHYCCPLTIVSFSFCESLYLHLECKESNGESWHLKDETLMKPGTTDLLPENDSHNSTFWEVLCNRFMLLFVVRTQLIFRCILISFRQRWRDLFIPVLATVWQPLFLG